MVSTISIKTHLFQTLTKLLFCCINLTIDQKQSLDSGVTVRPPLNELQMHTQNSFIAQQKCNIIHQELRISAVYLVIITTQ